MLLYFHLLLLFYTNIKLSLNFFLFLIHFHKNYQAYIEQYYSLFQQIFHNIQKPWFHLFQYQFLIDNIHQVEIVHERIPFQLIFIIFKSFLWLYLFQPQFHIIMQEYIEHYHILFQLLF